MGDANELRCAFCEKRQREVRKLVMGPRQVCICDECIGLCNDILTEHPHGVAEVSCCPS